MKRPAAALLGCIAILLLVTVAGIATIPAVQTGTWQPMGSMVASRSGAAAVLLQDHRVLITGGNDGNGAVNSAEVFNLDGTFSNVNAMGTPRAKHIAAVLQDGRVLVAGGETSGGAATNSAEIVDPASGSWAAVAGGMVEARSAASVSLLQDGRVFIAGGQNGTAPSQSAEIFDPVAGQFSYAGSLTAPRISAASAMLADGRVLITGGSNGNAALNTTDIFDPASNSISAGPVLTSPRLGHSATSLLDGRVLVAGGNNGSADMATAEIFDPASGSFAAAASTLAAPRRDHTAVLLPNNNSVLILGGTSNGDESNTVEMFTPWTGSFVSTGAMSVARQQSATSALSQDGLLLTAGGLNSSGTLASAELYGFATVKTDASDYAPGSIVTITGTGWQPGEIVTLTLVESPLVDTHPVMSAVADGQGNIINTQFSPDDHDVSIRFFLTAVGSQSGYQAQNTFTDAIKDYEATISPTTDTAGHVSAGYSITIQNDPTSTNSISSATIAVPSAYSSVVLGAVTTSPAGLNWTASIAAGVITLTGNGGSSQFLIGGQSVKLALTATAPCTNASYVWTTATAGNFSLQGPQPAVNITGSCNVPTTLVLNSVNPNSVAFGSSGSVTFTSTLTRNDTNAGVVGAAVNFTVDGVSVGSATTGLGGVATFSTYNPSSLSVALHNVAASFTAATIGGTQFGANSSGTLPLTVGKATPTITWSNPADITYGTALSATQLNATASVPGTFVYTPASGTVLNAGNSQTLHVDFTPTDSTNYTTASKSVSINVNQKPVTASITASDKAYDGTNTATITNCTIPGKVGTDDVACSASNATFASSNASSSPQTVTATVALTGGSAGNYNLGGNTTATTSAKINPRPVVATLTADDKIYDGTAAEPDAKLHCALAAGSAIGTDDVACTASAGTFNSSQVAAATTVTATITLSGTISANYTLGAAGTSLTSTTANASAHIKTAPLTATLTAADKFYDGSTTELEAAMTCSFAAVISGDSVTCTPSSGAFNTKDVATAVQVTATVTLGGGSAANYTLGLAGSFTTSNSATATAHISPKPVTARITAADKTYDGTATEPDANLHCTLPAGSAVGTDDVACSASNGSFNSSQVALATTVTANVTLTGSTSGNYSLTSTSATAPARIKTAPLTATLVAADKPYNGDTTEPDTAMSCTVATVFAPDMVTCTPSGGAFNSKDVLFASQVTAIVATSGPAAANYTLGAPGSSINSTSATATAHITPKTVSASITADDKIYDTTIAATIHCTLTGVLSADAAYVTCSGTGSFSDANAGAGKNVTSTNLSLGGSAAGNYVLSSTTASTTASIQTRALTATLLASDKVYDKSNAEPDANISCTLATVLGADNVTCKATNGTFNTSDVTATQVSATVTISGAASANYTLGAAGTSTTSTSATASAHIKTAPLTATLTAGDKVYDAHVTETSPMSCIVASVLAGDSVTCTASSGTFNSKDVLTANQVTATATISGTSAFNYTLGAAGSSTPSTSATATAHITPAPLTIQADNKTKIFGDVVPALTVSYVTLLGTDSPASLGGALLCSTTVVPLSPVDSYPNSINCSGQTSTNYNISYKPGSFTVTQASTGVMLTSSGSPSFLNSAVTFNAKVNPQFMGSTPTGTVTFTAKYFNASTSVTIGTAAVNASGVATLTYSALPVNANLITATYGGDTNFTGSNGSVTQTVIYASGICDGDAGHQILQPINADGSSVFNGKSTSPAKFRVCDANGVSIGNPETVMSFRLVGIMTGITVGAVDEAVVSTNPDSAFRWDPTAQQWIFNINNKSLGATNQTYYFQIMLNDGSSIVFHYGLK